MGVADVQVQLIRCKNRQYEVSNLEEIGSNTLQMVHEPILNGVRRFGRARKFVELWYAK